MFKLTFFFSALFIVVISLSMNFVLADDQERTQDVYGWQLMTPDERAEHRAKMRSHKTHEEREAYRMEHHKKMQERARKKGVTLPEMPMPRGKGMGFRGDGMGPRGGGMGPGGERQD